MKKSLIALAVLATAGVASAQSSVTLFGVVDATLQHGTGNGVGSADRTRLGNSGLSSSRIGFRGTEDLGGGMAASFWLEASAATDDGTGAGTNTNNQATGAAPALAGGQGLTFNRRSTVSLSGGFGEVRLGRDFSPQFLIAGTFDPFGYNGVGTTQTANNLGGVVSVRTSNGFTYFLPSTLGGFYGMAQVYLGENAKNGAATEDDGNGYGTRLGYAAGPVNVAFAVAKTNYATGDIKHVSVGGSYDFGVGKLVSHYQRERISAGATGKGWLIGGNIPLGVGEIRLSYSTYKSNAATTPTSKKYALGYVHNLSKRTALYATFAHVSNSGAAAIALNGATTAAGDKSSGYDFGLRHSF